MNWLQRRRRGAICRHAWWWLATWSWLGPWSSVVLPSTTMADQQHMGVSFNRDVLPILARQGCNSGACHGALAGKGGFRLSLRGYDPAADWFAITRDGGGRRVELSDPGQSLLLLKPTGTVAHRGGIRFDVGSVEYQLLADWLAQGAPGPDADEPQLQSISVNPEQSQLTVADEQHVFVEAHYDDGSIRDVTRWAKFASADEAVAGVDEDGHVTVRSAGQGAIVAWFGSKIAISHIVVPFAHQIDDAEFERAPTRNFIDQFVLEKLRQLNLRPAQRCSDAEFIRRTSLDTIGRLPDATEVQRFVGDDSADKRDAYIEILLSKDEFIDYWTYRWSDLLLINGTRLRPTATKSYYQWVREQVQQNTPWDVLVTKILTAQGTTSENGATNFYSLHQDPESMTENACQAFLGLSIGCAKCHNHPLEKWTNDQYYAMANLFARVRGKGWGGDGRNGDGQRTVYVVSQGDLLQPRTGRPQVPTPLDGQSLALDDPSDRRLHLARWMTSPENPYFARAITNRVWANFFQVGLVERVDDLRMSNPASNERLLSAAADHLIDHQFDLKELMRAILQSETYQRESLVSDGNREDGRFYARYYPRRMMAEVLLDSIDAVLETQTTFDHIAFPGADRQKIDVYAPGTRALQLYDAAVESYFLKVFGRHTREITCECERSNEPSLVQTLHLSNGDTLNRKLDASPRIQRWVNANASDDGVIDELYLLALAREPGNDERRSLKETLIQYGKDDRRMALADLCWSVLTSNEFLFNH
ncbi:MAG: DUF1549 and DUF1553 domain-containing protein [Pirellulaceae bacterium]|nr:DUF1553 domain-containing protein [Planctomycetales bacterium]